MNEYQLLFESLRRTKNQPIDYHYIISSLDAIDDEIPQSLRYYGQPFFSLLENRQYYFIKTQSNPDVIKDYVMIDNPVRNISVSTENYTDIITTLNNTFSHTIDKTGISCYIKPLNILVNHDGNNWVYVGGDYKISTLTVWETIPLTLKSIQKIVLVGSEIYTVGNDYILEQKLVVVDELPTTEDLRNFIYYKVGNSLYLVVDGYPYKIGLKTNKGDDPGITIEAYISPAMTIYVSSEYINHLSNDKNNIITHNLDANYVNVMIISPADSRNYSGYPDYEIIDKNSLSIKSMTRIENCQIIVTKLNIE